MKIDLEQALSDLARSVHDDGVTDRMNGQVRTMVGRIRRRRAARQTATGVVSLGAVAGLAVGAGHLWERATSTAPPASQEPEPEEPDTTGQLDLVCGEAVPVAPAIPEHLMISATPTDTSVTAGEPFPVTLLLGTTGTDPVGFDPATPIRYALLDDGVVVAHGDRLMDLDPVAPGETFQLDGELIPLEPCAGTIEPGDYQMVALFPLVEGDGGTQSLLTEPWSMRVTPEPAAGVADAAIADIIAASDRISAEYLFGACGTRVPVDQDVTFLRIDVDLPPGPYRTGSLIEGAARVYATEGLTVLANAPATAALVVLTRDGVVVGRGGYDPEHVSVVPFTDDNPYPLPAYGQPAVCTLPGAAISDLGLPPGTYQAYTTLEVALKEVQYPDGTAESYSHIEVARSEPVDVVIE